MRDSLVVSVWLPAHRQSWKDAFKVSSLKEPLPHVVFRQAFKP